MCVLTGILKSLFVLSPPVCVCVYRYFEVPGEKEFFDECKKSKNVVCHFYREATMR